MRLKEWNSILAGLALTAPVPLVARAETYLTESQAAAVLFPGVKLKPRAIELSSNDVMSIERNSGEKVPSTHPRVWWGPNQEALFFDTVLGKHEYITCAVAVSSDGKIKGVEIMDYREVYGYQVRGAGWRKQFIGKTSKDPIRLDKDIQNISGATLSSDHVTNGVRRVIFTYETIKQKA